jgi:hypothetical protein
LAEAVSELSRCFGDGSLASSNDDGYRMMRAIRDASVQDFYLNLMVMDDSEAIPRNCVVSAGVCDMGRSAIQVARNCTSAWPADACLNGRQPCVHSRYA